MNSIDMTNDINMRSRAYINVSNAFRIAALQIHESTIGIAHDGKENGRCKLNGIIGEVFSIVFDKLQDRGFGCIALTAGSIGVRNKLTNQYSGAVGLVQKGEVDFVGMPVYFPLNETEEKFRYSPMLMGDTMTILSSYWINTTTYDGDIISMFANIPTGLWIGYFMSFVTFVLVSFIGSKLLGLMFESLWMTICAFLEQDNYPLALSKFTSWMSFVVMLVLFFMVTYAENLMGTDLVTIEKPIAITTYKQIISGNITSLINVLLPEWERFSSAEEGSNEWALFQRKKPVSLDIGATAGLLMPFLGQKVAFISRPFVTVTVALIIIAFSGWPSTARIYAAPDPQASNYINVFVYSSRLKDTPLEHYMNLIVGRMNEHGFSEFVQARSGLLIVKSVMAEGGTSAHQQFITSKVEEQSPELQEIGWQHFYRTLAILAIGSVSATLALLGEHVHWCYFVSSKAKWTLVVRNQYPGLNNQVGMNGHGRHHSRNHRSRFSRNLNIRHIEV